MRSLTLLAAIAVILAVVTPNAEAACNARGQFCNHPAWASNAFAGKSGRVVNPYNSTSVKPSKSRSR